MKISGGIKDIVKAVGTRLIPGLFFISALTTLIISEAVNFHMNAYEISVNETTNSHLRASVKALAGLISAEDLDRFHTIEDTDDPYYQEIREQLIRFAEEYDVLYAYYWRDYGDGMLQYIADNDTDPETQVGLESFYEIEKVALDALAGNIGVTDLGTYTPTWDGLLTGYAPVFDNDGNISCVAGVDISDEFIIRRRESARQMTILQITAIPIAIIFGILNVLLYRRKARQIEEANNKLQYFNNNLRHAFSTYLSEDVVEEIVSDPTRLHLGGEKRYMTALFTDIRGFSTIAEALSPEYLVELLNYYLSTMSDIILEQKGTIDKYEGDAIVSFFGAPLVLPDHALRACLAAIMMKRIEADVNSYIKKNDLSPSPLFTRMGINSGDMVVGNMGTQKKMNYTIVSNAVNLAARLEGVNKQYGTWILASENTINAAQGRLLSRRLDRIRVMGIQEPVRIHEILETEDNAPADLLEKVHLFHNAHDFFETRRWEESLETFNQLLARFPDDEPSLLYARRCRRFIEFSPPDGWDGVFNFDEK
ncbi:MAG: adenylate/guanylate cyclase domain-containing protein [Treponema sp.]|nr:adenylate/guanylate cyclase domain-containing protein [Treponema sp.]